MSIFDVCGQEKRPVHSLEGWPPIKATPRFQESHPVPMVLDKKQLHSKYSKSYLVVNVAMFSAPFDQLY